MSHLHIQDVVCLAITSTAGFTVRDRMVHVLVSIHILTIADGAATAILTIRYRECYHRQGGIDMIVRCQSCKIYYDDEFRLTECPHQAFPANDGNGNFTVHDDSYCSAECPDEPIRGYN